MSYWSNFDVLKGKPLKTVALIKGQYEDQLQFTFQDNSRLTYVTDADCCSTSWIEHITVPSDIEGAVITDVKDSGGVDATPEQEEQARAARGYVDVLAVYHTSFVTDRGEIIVEYRNDSNGYYGGSLSGPREGVPA